jgi:hypothetical protein
MRLWSSLEGGMETPLALVFILVPPAWNTTECLGRWENGKWTQFGQCQKFNTSDGLYSNLVSSNDDGHKFDDDAVDDNDDDKEIMLLLALTLALLSWLLLDDEDDDDDEDDEGNTNDGSWSFLPFPLSSSETTSSNCKDFGKDDDELWCSSWWYNDTNEGEVDEDDEEEEDIFDKGRAKGCKTWYFLFPKCLVRVLVFGLFVDVDVGLRLFWFDGDDNGDDFTIDLLSLKSFWLSLLLWLHFLVQIVLLQLLVLVLVLLLLLIVLLSEALALSLSLHKGGVEHWW